MHNYTVQITSAWLFDKSSFSESPSKSHCRYSTRLEPHLLGALIYISELYEGFKVPHFAKTALEVCDTEYYQLSSNLRFRGSNIRKRSFILIYIYITYTVNSGWASFLHKPFGLNEEHNLTVYTRSPKDKLYSLYDQ
jgi:hypothetical protein